MLFAYKKNFRDKMISNVSPELKGIFFAPTPQDISVLIFKRWIVTINDFYRASLVCKKFKQLAQKDEVIRNLFSRTFFALLPSRYPMPQNCASGREILTLKNLQPNQCFAIMELNQYVSNYVQIASNGTATEVYVREHPHLYDQDIVDDVINFLCKYGKDVRNIPAIIRKKNLFLNDRQLNQIITTVTGLSALVLGRTFPNHTCSELPTDHLPGITDEGLKNIGLCTNLQTLSLKVRCHRITAKTFERLKACTQLTKLAFRTDYRLIEKYPEFCGGFSLSKDQMEGLEESGNYQNLPQLKFEGIQLQELQGKKKIRWEIDREQQTITFTRPREVFAGGLKDEEIRQIAKLTSLTELNVSLYKNKSSALFCLTQLTHLKTFKMNNDSDYWNLKDNAFFDVLARLTNLRTLSLARIRIAQDSSLQNLTTSLTVLQTLKLDDIDFGKDSLAGLSLSTSLQNLHLSCLDLGYYTARCATKENFREAVKFLLKEWGKSRSLKSVNLDLFSCKFKLEEVKSLTDCVESTVNSSLQTLTFRNIEQKDPKNPYRPKRLNCQLQRNEVGEFKIESITDR